MTYPLEVAVVGQVARDLVLVVDEVPGGGQSAPVRRRREMLGGKGANQAVALAQLGVPVAVVGVVGDDLAGERVLGQARGDGIGVSGVVCRPGAATGLVVDVVDAAGRWHYLEDLPDPVLLTAADVGAAAGLIGSARWVCVQLQQPPEAARAAVELARQAGGRVVLDGAPPEEHQDALLASADVVRCDAHEAELLAGGPIGSAGEALRFGAGLLERGPSMVAVAAGEPGNVFVWRDGHAVLPLLGGPVVDTTGAGDALTAALTAALARGEQPARAARLAAAAAAATVGHPGGRPALTAPVLDEQLARLDAATG
jgi:ribokinase